MRAGKIGLMLAGLLCLGLPPEAGAKPSAGAPATAAPAATAAAPATTTSASPSTASFESQMLAYAVVDRLSADIANDVCNNVQRSRSTRLLRDLVIYDQASFANVLAFGSFKENALIVGDAYNQLASPPPDNPTPATVQIATGPDGSGGKIVMLDPDANFSEAIKLGNLDKFLDQERKRRRLNDMSASVGASTGGGASVSESFSFSPVTDLVSLVGALATSSNAESYGAITIPDSAIAIAVTQQLRARPGCQLRQVVYPPIFGSGSASYSPTADIHAIATQLTASKWRAHRAIDSTLTTASGTSGAPVTAPKSTENIAELADIDGLYDNLINSLIQPNATTGVVGMASIAQGDALTQLIDGPLDATGHVVIDDPGEPTASARGAYILLATVLAAGGTVRDHKTIWTNLTVGDDIKYSGGLVVAVSLWDLASAKPFFTENLRCRTPLTREEHLTDVSIVCTKIPVPSQASQVRYFRICPNAALGAAPASACGSADDFVVALTSPAQLQKADAILSGTIKDAVHPMGAVVAGAASYNPAWKFHLDPDSITFGTFSNPSCWGFTTSQINAKLDKVGTPDFLPLKVWCPRGYQLAEEVKD